jgi:ubiquinone/menaquinone biosynthesis C-methylase UbiE
MNYIEQYDKCGETYFFLHQHWYRNRVNLSRQKIYAAVGDSLTNKKLLDVGCGFGEDMAYFQQKGAEVHGIELSKTMIKIAEREYPSLGNISLQDFHQTNFSDNYFDIITSRYTVHYSTDLKKALVEFHRILKPDGHLIILVANPLLTFFAKEKFFYGDKSDAEIPIYGGAFSVIEPSHTFTEYLNLFVLENFEIKEISESPGLENTDTEAKIKKIVPDFLFMKLIKKPVLP